MTLNGVMALILRCFMEFVYGVVAKKFTFAISSSDEFLVTLFFGSRPDRSGRPISTIYTSYDVFPRKKVPFGGRDTTAPHFGGQIQKERFWGVNGRFQA